MKVSKLNKVVSNALSASISNGQFGSYLIENDFMPPGPYVYLSILDNCIYVKTISISKTTVGWSANDLSTHMGQYFKIIESVKVKAIQ